LNDGAAALLLANSSGLRTHSLTSQSQILSSAVVGVEPRIMGIGPVEASKLALQRAGLTLADMDCIELNEAFAAQALACTRTLGLDDRDERINPNGGAIALGHPLGMTGARLLLTASKHLVRTGKEFALVTMCVGVGQGYAAVIRNASQDSIH
jgi:acetyl-CoA acetyltransferase family protein